jgi:DNA-binding LacI/PurR family transcriptional regulator
VGFFSDKVRRAPFTRRGAGQGPAASSRIARVSHLADPPTTGPAALTASPRSPALGAPRRRKPTIEDVADLAGVSRGTVSRVLNGAHHVRHDLVESVNNAIEALGYSVNQAARNLAAGRTGSVAFVISEHQERLFEDPNFGTFVKVFTRELRLQGRHLLVTVAGDHEEETFLGNYLSAGHVDGALLALPRLGEPMLARLANSHLPLVVMGRPLGYENSGLSWVAVDDEAGAHEMVTYLLGRGRSRIATVTGPLHTSSGRGRFEGYRRATGEAFRDSLAAEGDWSVLSGRLCAERILHQHPDIDAVFAASDLMALGVIAALRQAGRRVPEDVAVAGFDDSAAATMAEPPLTTMRNPLEESAVEAVNILDALMTGRSGPRQVVLPTALVPRQSA